MKKIIKTEKLPIKLWTETIEPNALRQAKNLANFPYSFKHVAIMPDVHEGYGMPIGGVLAVKKVIIPHAVGVDIGCGVCALKSSIKKIDRSTLKKIMSDIRKIIPLGFKKHAIKEDEALMPKIKNLKNNCVKKEWDNACKSLGTLGGGNHFIEIQRDSHGYIWIMVHSGSRNLGLKVANYYNKIAIALNKKMGFEEQIKQGLAFLFVESKEGQAYLDEMKFCVDFALANRKLIIERIKKAFEKNIKEKIDWSDFINIAHNYASEEPSFGEKVFVHRKGATSAKKGEFGIVPGSQGSKSYIVKGLGNKESFESCSHGAGRIMGRKEAIRKLDLKKETNKLNQLGVIHAIRGKKDLDEASGAYKNISTVMENQRDLVKVIEELSPLAVIKG